MDTIKRIKLVKMPSKNQPFVINTCKILDTEEYLKSFESEPKQNNVLTSIINLLREDFESIISEAEKIINEYIKAKSNKPDKVIFKETLNSFKKALEPLSNHLKFDAKSIFINDLIVQTCKISFSSYFPMIKGEIIIAQENYKNYKDFVINLVNEEIKQAFPKNKKEIIYDIEEYLLSRIADYTKEPIFILQEIKQSLLWLKNIFNAGIPETITDIHTQLYMLVKKYGGVITNTEIDNFLPKLIKSECESLMSGKSDILNHINRFSHLIFLMIYRILKHKVPIKQCPACENFFIPSRPNKIYCDSTLPDSDILCRKKGPQLLRNRRLPPYRIEYEKAIKRIKSYGRRHDLGTEETNRRLAHFSSNYYDELKKLEKNFTPKHKSSYDKTGYSRDELLNAFSKKIKDNCKNYLDNVDPPEKWV